MNDNTRQSQHERAPRTWSSSGTPQPHTPASVFKLSLGQPSLQSRDPSTSESLSDTCCVPPPTNQDTRRTARAGTGKRRRLQSGTDQRRVVGALVAAVRDAVPVAVTQTPPFHVFHVNLHNGNTFDWDGQ